MTDEQLRDKAVYGGAPGRYAEIYAKAFSGEPWHDPWNEEDAAVHLSEILE